MTVGSIVRRHGETRQYRVIGFRERVAIGTDKVLLAILQPLHESIVKHILESPDKLIEVKYPMGT